MDNIERLAAIPFAGSIGEDREIIDSETVGVAVYFQNLGDVGKNLELLKRILEQPSHHERIFRIAKKHRSRETVEIVYRKVLQLVQTSRQE